MIFIIKLGFCKLVWSLAALQIGSENNFRLRFELFFMLSILQLLPLFINSEYVILCRSFELSERLSKRSFIHSEVFVDKLTLPHLQMHNLVLEEQVVVKVARLNVIQ